MCIYGYVYNILFLYKLYTTKQTCVEIKLKVFRILYTLKLYKLNITVGCWLFVYGYVCKKNRNHICSLLILLRTLFNSLKLSFDKQVKDEFLIICSYIE